MDQVDQGIDSVRSGKAPRVPMLLWVRSEVLQEWLQPRLGARRPGDPGPARVDGRSTGVTSHGRSDTHHRVPTAQ
jgi:hypothetical protein